MEGLLDLWTDELKELLQRNLTKWAEIPETRIIELMAPKKQQMVMAKFKRWQSDQMQEKGTGDLKNQQNNNNNSGNLAAKLSWHLFRTMIVSRMKMKVIILGITHMAESEEELKSLLMKMKEESEKVKNSTFRKPRSWDPVPSLHGK